MGCMALRKMIKDGYQMPPEFSKGFIDTFLAHDKQTFGFVLQDKKFPFSTRLWAMTPYVSEIGATAYMTALRRIKDFYDNPQYANITQSPIAYPDVELITEGMIFVSTKF
jgi:hypothetical protein